MSQIYNLSYIYIYVYKLCLNQQSNWLIVCLFRAPTAASPRASRGWAPQLSGASSDWETHWKTEKNTRVHRILKV